MYIEEAIAPLVKTLETLCCESTSIIMAYGRNRGAEMSFLAQCSGIFTIAELASHELDSRYQCTDVKVLKLQRHRQNPLSQDKGLLLVE